MSAYENFRKNVEYAEKGEKDVTVSRKVARHVVNEVDSRLKAIESIQNILKGLPLHAGDVVCEVKNPIEKGDVVEVRETEDETIYLVFNRHRRRTFIYHRDELTLMERPEV